MPSGYIDIPVHRKLELYLGEGIGIRQSRLPGFQIETPMGMLPMQGTRTNPAPPSI